jgi:DNA-binding NarL/FixJ family response regulator
MSTLRLPAEGATPARRRAVARSVRVAVLMGHESALDEVCSILRSRAPELDVVVGATGWLRLVRSPGFPTEVVVLDCDLADPVSLEGRVRSCRAAGASVVLLSRSGSAEARRRALGSGAAALLVGPVPAREIVAAVRSVVAGARAGVPEPEPDPPFASARLSQGEEQALRLYVTGRSTQDVAVQMNVQYETAKTYLRRVRAKYRSVGRTAGLRADLIERASEDGYLR